MDNKDYLETLKTINMQPKRIKIESQQETVLMEADLSNKEKTIRQELIKWFIDNPYPDDKKVHAYAESKGINEHELEGHIYAILCSFLCEGKSKGKDIKHDPKELEMGIKVEMEHTVCPIISRKIALDHLEEIKDYYTRLKKMEEEAGVKD